MVTKALLLSQQQFMKDLEKKNTEEMPDSAKQDS